MGHIGPGHDDPYRVLGVDAGASPRDIARAYHRAAQRAHPDARPDDPAAAARFQALTDAYDLLSDPGRRARYDRSQLAAGTGSPPQRRSGTAAVRRHGCPYPPGALWQQPVWAGPVLIEPPDASLPTGQRWHSPPAAAWTDPPVVLGVRVDGAWGWAW